jgi:hypothetical protein
MAAMLRRLPALAGLAGLAGTGAELAGHRAFTRMVRREVQALRARGAPGRAGVVTEEMLADLPEPVRRYLRYTGIAGRPVPGTIQLRQEGQMRPGPRPAVAARGAEEHFSVHPPGLVWAGTVRVGPLTVGRARDMYAEGKRADPGQGGLAVAGGRRQRRADGQAAMMRYLSDMTWFPPPAGGQYLLRASRWLLSPGRAHRPRPDRHRHPGLRPAGTIHRLGARRYWTAGASRPETWSTPVAGYGEFEGLRLPARGTAIYKLPGGDLEYIDVTITDLHYDTGAAAPEGRPR